MLQGKAGVVTGAAQGLGRATALRLSRRGWEVYATARRLDPLAPLAAAGCRTLPLDVTDEGSMQAAVERVEGEHGALDALVNNAGYSQSGAVETVPVDLVRQGRVEEAERLLEGGPVRHPRLVARGCRGTHGLARIPHHVRTTSDPEWSRSAPQRAAAALRATRDRRNRRAS